MANNLGNLTIGLFAKAAGVNVETIRFYQRKGLLPEPDKPYGSIRRYGGADVVRVKFVIVGPAAGVQPGRDCRAAATRRWHPLRGSQQPGRAQAQGRAREDGRLGTDGGRVV